MAVDPRIEIVALEMAEAVSRVGSMLRHVRERTVSCFAYHDLAIRPDHASYSDAEEKRYRRRLQAAEEIADRAAKRKRNINPGGL